MEVPVPGARLCMCSLVLCSRCYTLGIRILGALLRWHKPRSGEEGGRRVPARLHPAFARQRRPRGMSATVPGTWDTVFRSAHLRHHLLEDQQRIHPALL